MKKCEVCGRSDNETRVIGNLCRKHYLQVYRYGRTFNRTIYDPNEISVNGEECFIHLYDTKGNLIAKSLIDIDDIEKIRNIKWYTKRGYVRGTYQSKKIFLHRFLLNVPDDKFVDHINGDPLDNRKVNLRICSHKENIRNMRKQDKKIKGVFITPSGKWAARICVDYKDVWLGSFDTREEAEKNRLDAELKYFKEFSPNYNN